MNTDTPKTDAVIDSVAPYFDSSVTVALETLSRQLERELTAEQEKVKRLREALAKFENMDSVDLGNRLTNLARNDFMRDCPEYVGYCKSARATLESTK